MLAADLVLPSAIISLGALGLAFGLVLALASRVFHVDVDPRIEQVEEALPGAQCGACGQPGCAPYAEAVVAGEMEPNLCIPGGASVARAVAGILGVAVGEVTPMVAVTRCKGGQREAMQRAEYDGIQDCNAAVLVAGGPKGCVYGCLGFGTCVKACPFDAMGMSDNGLPVVFEDKCTGCGSCVAPCPRGIMELIPRTQQVYLGCVSQDRGKEVKAVCTVGCQGCKACTKPKWTPSGKVQMGENVPVLPSDWEDFQTAIAKCPGKAFMVRAPGLPALEAEEPAEAEA
ncbi:MAG: RnfABCDGE type electron transport complex subunit B [Planctomycetota bacterium]|jgi:RnfABCDGE-type electron transport complex B subunit